MRKLFATPTPPVARSFKEKGSDTTVPVSANENGVYLKASESVMAPGTFRMPTAQEVFPLLTKFRRMP